MRKPNSNAKLKTLPAEQQEKLWQYLQAHDYTSSIMFVQKEFGVRTSEAALSGFYAWYPLTKQLEEAASLTSKLKAELAQMPELDLSDEQLSAAAQLIFEKIAIEQKNSKLFIGLRKLRLKDRAQAASERRLALLEQKAREADAANEVASDSKLSPEEKRAKLAQIFGVQG